MEESPDSMLFYTYLPSEPLSKDRVEAFSDGVYAIVATLLILDIWFVLLPVLLGAPVGPASLVDRRRRSTRQLRVLS